MYTCGPTVYRYAHVGNLRSYLLADLIRRALLYHGLDVLHVKNITDVGHLRDEQFDRGEDRMLVQAGLESKTPAEIAAAYEAAFHADEAAVNILPAQRLPAGHRAHPGDGRAGRAAPGRRPRLRLGRRQRLLRGRLVPGLRAAVGQHARRAAGRASRRGRAGQARPGRLRALEGGRRGPDPELGHAALGRRASRAGTSSARRWRCATWATGSTSTPAASTTSSRTTRTRSPSRRRSSADVPANLWVHGEHLLMGGQKMAKSAGNFQRVTELAERGLDPLALRYLALTSRYGRKLDYSDASVAAAAAALDSLRSRLRGLGAPPADGPWAAPPALHADAAGDRPEGVVDRGRWATAAADGARTARSTAAHEPAAPLSPAGLALHDRFVAAIDDDLDLPTALAVVRETLRADLPADERRWLVLDADASSGWISTASGRPTAPMATTRGPADDAATRGAGARRGTRPGPGRERDLPAADAARDRPSRPGLGRRPTAPTARC